MLWPADEPWPVCASPDHEEIGEPVPTIVAILQIFARDVPELSLPEPCVLSPERVSEYPHGWELDEDLREQVRDWAAGEGWEYFSHLGAAPGTKVGGWPDWIQDPSYPECDECGKPMTHMLTIASWECDGESWRRWVPAEEFPLGQRREDTAREAFAHSKDAGPSLADAGSMFLMVCESCPDHPVKDVSQCS